MPKCPKCNSEVPEPKRNWKYGNFEVSMYLCSCGNQFREYYHEGKVNFRLSEHNGTLGGRPKKAPNKTHAE